MKKDWAEYFQLTKYKSPSKLLIKALKYVVRKNKAIDIGGGALRDTRYLLSLGFDVTVVDKEELMAFEAQKIKSHKIHPFVAFFANFDFRINEFNVANAQFALPFNSPDSFNNIFTAIKNSLVKGGVFCGQLFGIKDQWSTRPEMTFQTKKQAEKLLSDMEIIYFTEEESDDVTVNGMPKHWHIFHFIARKK